MYSCYNKHIHKWLVLKHWVNQLRNVIINTGHSEGVYSSIKALSIISNVIIASSILN